MTSIVVPIPRTTAGPRLAREHAARMAVAHRVPSADVTLLTSELVTNAIIHGEAPIRLVLSCTGGTLRIEVHDGAGDIESVRRQPLDHVDPHGRGLELVARIAHDWGTAAGPDGNGKVVWAECRVSAEQPHERARASGRFATAES
jgi:anti-sigma regulatory factor (Ser/Thr protein kinase)